MVPHERNPFFTGRTDVLDRLRTALVSGKSTALTQAIKGLGGIGKTQTAVEYAYRHRADYTHVLWIVADTLELATSGLAEIARVLGLPEYAAQDRSVTVAAVQAWLRANDGWLFVLDNADDLAVVRKFLPPDRKGHVILTTRATAFAGIAEPIKIKKLDPKDGALFLLRRAGLLAKDAALADASEDYSAAALELTSEMDGLPLALDQAGAYIEETPSTPRAYLDLYRKRRGDLLARSGSLSATDHASVAVTFSLALEKVEAANPASAELLRFCAFLAPDAIPMEILSAGVEHLGDVLGPAMADDLKRDEIIAGAYRWSLLERDPRTDTIAVHRVVQEVIRESTPPETRRIWAERIVDALSSAFPNPVFSNWPKCDKFVPHALACAVYADVYGINTAAAGRLFNDVGCYLRERADYAEAEPLYRRALVIREQALGPDHPGTATILNNLAALLYAQGNYAEAEPLYCHALEIRERVLGPDHPDTATSLNNLAALLYAHGNYAEAEPLYRRALEIRERVLGPDHPGTASSLNNLAVLLYVQGNYAEAEPLYRRALEILEHALGPDHPDTARSLDGLARWLRDQRNYAEAEPLHRRALLIYEKALGRDHPDTATSLNNLAGFLCDQGNYAEAEPLYRRALEIFEKALGPDHPYTELSFANLGRLLRKMGRLDEAAEYERRAEESRAAHARRNAAKPSEEQA